MKIATVDFETFYDKDVSVVNLGTANYAKASDAYIVGVLVDGEVRCGTLAEMGEFCRELAKDPTVKPMAANANFDRAFWEKYFPAFQQDWHCLLDHAAFHQFPRNLMGLTGTVLGEKIDKTKRDEMKGVHYEDLPVSEQEAVQQYCATDCIKEAECLSAMTPMSAFEERVAAHTRTINRRGVCVNTDLVEADKTKISLMRFEALRAIPWHTEAPPLSYAALVRYCQVRNLPVPKTLSKVDEDTAELMSDNAELSQVIGLMRRFRRANTMLKKVATLQARLTDDNILPLDILYCGAPHTRRWSSKGFNIQNLDKEPLIISPEVGQVWTRNWFVPRPDHVFLIFDFAQIEPRCLNWLAGNEDMMAALRHGFSYYEAYVTAAKQAARVGWSGKPGAMKAELGKVKYTKVKNESLGCGYGMGASKYTTYANVTEEEAKAVITGFRSSNPLIVNMWRKLDNLIRTAARDKSRHLALELPTGELLQHFHLRCKAGGFESFTTKDDFGHTSRQPRLWGGTLTENVTQRMARDVMANAILNLEDAGLPVRWHVHDEVILEVPRVSAAEAMKEAERILTVPPAWAPDLPLGVEGDMEDCYTKK